MQLFIFPPTALKVNEAIRVDVEKIGVVAVPCRSQAMALGKSIYTNIIMAGGLAVVDSPGRLRLFVVDLLL